MSLRLKRYFEPLRLPFRANALSFPYTHQSVASPPPQRVSSTGQYIFLSMPSLLPRETPRATSVIPARVQRPSPFDHRVGISISHTRLLIGSLALRPAILLLGNSRPRVTATPLPHANKAYGQLLVRDFNPLDALLLLRTVRSCVLLQTSRQVPSHSLSRKGNRQDLTPHLLRFPKRWASNSSLITAPAAPSAPMRWRRRNLTATGRRNQPL